MSLFFWLYWRTLSHNCHNSVIKYSCNTQGDYNEKAISYVIDIGVDISIWTS
jgi:hypothetical protein